MEMDIDDILGRREVENDRGSGSEGDGNDDGEDSDDGGLSNPFGEALEVPEPGQQTATQQPVKPKRVIKNPQPKLDVHRVAGPRGIGILQKSFKDVKFKGKGHEKEDLTVLLKRLEHWAHRLFPKLPFRDVLTQLEKLGSKKPVQVQMNRLRLDMFTEINNETAEDNVRRGTDEEEAEKEPEIDVFDELLGQSGFPRVQQDLPPAAIIPSSQPAQSLSDEQKERLERNKRLAAEKRLARLKQQEEYNQASQNSQQDTAEEMERIVPENVIGKSSSHEVAEDPTTTAVEAMETESEQAEEIPSQEKVAEDPTTITVETMETEGEQTEEVACQEEELQEEGTAAGSLVNDTTAESLVIDATAGSLVIDELEEENVLGDKITPVVDKETGYSLEGHSSEIEKEAMQMSDVDTGEKLDICDRKEKADTENISEQLNGERQLEDKVTSGSETSKDLCTEDDIINMLDDK